MAASPDHVDDRRVQALTESPIGPGPVVYWMNRDQRADDNWALLHAADIARRRRVPVIVAFCLTTDFLGASIRQYGFMLRGLKQTAADLDRVNIPFILLRGDPGVQIPRLVARHKAGALVSDFLPLHIKDRWIETICEKISCAFHEVDAHNVVPCWVASDKQEFAARTIRPKIHRKLDEFLTDFPPLERQGRDHGIAAEPVDWDAVLDGLRVARAVKEVGWLEPGPGAAGVMLEQFIKERLDIYDSSRNDPNVPAQSDLSPYIHFGQVAPQRAALAVMQSRARPQAKDAFIEELIVRRELSDNFCFYNEQYDRYEGLPDWSRRTLDAHRGDRRSPGYSPQDMELARTGDRLWNAAQIEMVHRGKMHGYMRMYWAKKILEWSRSPAEAIRVAIDLNDRYELDGRSPNGYVGVLWSIGGLHDRPWKERPVFGKVRYMSQAGCRRKFNVDRYVRRQYAGAGRQGELDSPGQSDDMAK